MNLRRGRIWRALCGAQYMSVIPGKADSIDPACEIQPSHRFVCRFLRVLLACYTGIIFFPVEIRIASVICPLTICYY